jgi:hypothetical protein
MKYFPLFYMVSSGKIVYLHRKTWIPNEKRLYYRYESCRESDALGATDALPDGGVGGGV